MVFLSHAFGKFRFYYSRKCLGLWMILIHTYPWSNNIYLQIPKNGAQIVRNKSFRNK